MSEMLPTSLNGLMTWFGVLVLLNLAVLMFVRRYTLKNNRADALAARERKRRRSARRKRASADPVVSDEAPWLKDHDPDQRDEYAGGTFEPSREYGTADPDEDDDDGHGERHYDDHGENEGGNPFDFGNYNPYAPDRERDSDLDNDREWNTGNQYWDRGPTANFLQVNQVKPMLAAMAECLGVPEVFQEVPVPAGPNAYRDLLATLDASGHTVHPETRACLLANYGSRVLHVGFPVPAMKALDDALAALFDLTYESTTFRSAAQCIADLCLIDYPGAAKANAELRDVLLNTKHPVALQSLFDLISRNRDAVKVRLIAPASAEQYAEAWAAVQNEDWATAISLLEKVARAFEEGLGSTEVRWPLVAAYYDLAYCKLNAGGFVESALSDMAAAQRLAQTCDSQPWPGFRERVLTGADLVLKRKGGN